MTVFTIGKEVGEKGIDGLQIFGRFHVIQSFWLCLPLIMVSMLHMNYVFIAEVPEFRCAVPECESHNASVETPEWWPTDVESKCRKPLLKNEFLTFNSTDQTCSASSFEGDDMCNDWIYENQNSVVSAFNLGCKSWEASLIGTIHNLAMMLSMSLTGWLSDKIGRKPTVIMCSIGGFVGLFKVFVPNLYFYLILEFLESFLASGLYSVAIILLIEIGGETKRIMAGVIFAYATYVGEVVYAVLAMSLKYWKFIILVIYSPMILFLSYQHIIKESTRWQMIRGRMDGAKDTFKSIAKMNKLDVTNEEIDALSDDEIKTRFNVESQKEKEKMRDILKSKHIMTRLGVSCACFFTSSLLYYGLVVNALYLPGDKYTNFIMASVTSFPGDVLAFFCLKRFGRKITLQCGYLLSAAFLVAQVYVPESIPWLKVLLFLLGKLGVVVCFTSIYTYSMELFPTSVRGSLFGIGSTISRAGAMLAPLTPLLATILTELPSILFASTAIMSACVVVFTPETKFLPLFDTIAQVDAYEENKKKIDNSTRL